jgi:hypothetical protein
MVDGTDTETSAGDESRRDDEHQDQLFHSAIVGIDWRRSLHKVAILAA